MVYKMTRTPQHKYILALNNMIKEFAKRYYSNEDWYIQEYNLIWWRDTERHPWPVKINDDYWSIEQIHDSLQNNFDYERMEERKEREMDIYPKDMKVNFFNYNRYIKTYDLDGNIIDE